MFIHLDWWKQKPAASTIRSDILLTSDAPPLFQNDEDHQSAAQVYDTPAVFLHPVLELVFR